MMERVAGNISARDIDSPPAVGAGDAHAGGKSACAWTNDPGPFGKSSGQASPHIRSTRRPKSEREQTMTDTTPNQNPTSTSPVKESRLSLQTFPWWLVLLAFFLLYMGYQIFADVEYSDAMGFIQAGITTTIRVTIVSFLIGTLIGLLSGLGRISRNVIIRNLSITYIEFIRGVPILVLIFTVALVIVPDVSELFGFQNRAIPQEWRVVIALALIYGAYLAEVFRAGIEAVEKGQMEAALSVGLTRIQSMRFIILPQAIRNILPALGNNFISMLKDSSLVSVLAVGDITYQARLYSGSSFRFRETYLVLTFLYLFMTIILSLLLQWYERTIQADKK